MPWRLHAEAEQRRLYVELHGMVSAADHRALMQAGFDALSDQRDGWTSIYELRGLEGYEASVDGEFVQGIAHQLGAFLEGAKDVRSAWIFDEVALKQGMVNMFNALSNRGQRVIHARTLAEALTVLEIDGAWLPDWAHGDLPDD